MKRILIKTKVYGRPSEIMKGFTKDLLLKLTPPMISVELTRYDGNKLNDEIHIVSSIFGSYQSWVNFISDTHESEKLIYFTDTAREMPSPLTSWEHKHKVQMLDDKYSYIIDDIRYDTGSKLMNNLIYPLLYAFMYYRKPIYMDTFNEQETNL
ncbi:hypothetical protein [Bacteriovorax sp. DB6_IX]|uniref:hypothetical protein n=1 Tax=Bacteriovorax sp. DB6_IX TaxID=1353530 RepID=UPI000554C911|nr:hypothetical protein [Bacteriovorax sp. DB6_IX]